MFDTMLVCHFVDPNLVVAIIFVRKEQQKKRGLILEQGVRNPPHTIGSCGFTKPTNFVNVFLVTKNKNSLFKLS